MLLFLTTSAAAAASTAAIIDLIQMPSIVRPASKVLADLAEQAALVEGDFSDEPAGIFDVYGNGRWTEEFQTQVAEDLGKEAGLFMPTGVCAQATALSVYAGLPLASRSALRQSFITHATSHLLLWEERSYSDLLGLTAIAAGEKHRPLMAADVEVELKRLRAVGLSPCCIVVEVPWRELGCTATPWDELLAMRALANEYGVPLHMDGARLLEIAPYYQRTPAEVAALFDSVYVSFYKGLGALSGAMLLGSARFVAAAAPWRRRLGGNAYTSLPMALSCRAAYDAHRDSFEARWHALRRAAAAIVALDGRVRFEPAEPQCCHAAVYVAADADALVAARDAALEQTGVRVFRRLRAEGVGEGGRECYWEWLVGPDHCREWLVDELGDELVLGAWRAFLAALPPGED